MNLPLLTKMLSRSVQCSSSFPETFSYGRVAGKSYIDKACYVAMNETNNTCISCVFNGFKYSSNTSKD